MAYFEAIFFLPLSPGEILVLKLFFKLPVGGNLELMKNRLPEWILIVTMLVISIGGIAMLGMWRALGRAPSLDAVRALAREQRFGQAQALLHRYLQLIPRTPEHSY